ncbi:hypothetical protein [Streptomyces otsuchiensis]|uniref:hypothetical protein n=1 Tax=Streptomyces otsuchiensis TaxID=2681388 RepID=UPI00102FBBC6|nr:hypothetical protein [Streptomyces otsuchiensis]
MNANTNTVGKAGPARRIRWLAVRDFLPCLGVVTGLTVWMSRALPALGPGFEGEDRDLSVLTVDLPLIMLGGALVPLLAWRLAPGGAGRPWAPALAALAGLALAVWGLTEWWHPHRASEPVGPGL